MGCCFGTPLSRRRVVMPPGGMMYPDGRPVAGNAYNVGPAGMYPQMYPGTAMMYPGSQRGGGIGKVLAGMAGGALLGNVMGHMGGGGHGGPAAAGPWPDTNGPDLVDPMNAYGGGGGGGGSVLDMFGGGGGGGGGSVLDMFGGGGGGGGLDMFGGGGGGGDLFSGQDAGGLGDLL